jgi:hypothetical protein
MVLFRRDVIVMVCGRRLYSECKFEAAKEGLQVDGRTVDPNSMDPGLKSTHVGSMGVGIVALAVSNCALFRKQFLYPVDEGEHGVSFRLVDDIRP